jgi:hypothetical protein
MELMRRVIIFIIFLTSCNLPADTKKSGMYKNSQSIEESKENGVFRFQVNVNKPVVHIDNSKTDTIKEIWVENMWMYTDQRSIQKDSTEQILILFGNSSKDHNDKLLIKRGKDYFGWNGVFFDSYAPDLMDTLYIISTATGSPRIMDTILVNKDRKTGT